MTPDQIVVVVERYEQELQRRKIPKHPVPLEGRSLSELNTAEQLALAHHLCDKVREYVRIPGSEWECGKFYGFLQACLSSANCYTFTELRAHNHPLCTEA